MSRPLSDPAASRVDTLTSALLYLMSSYYRAPCPRIALMVLRHMEAICGHDQAPPVLRQMCQGLCGDWAGRACAGGPGPACGPGRGRVH